MEDAQSNKNDYKLSQTVDFDDVLSADTKVWYNIHYQRVSQHQSILHNIATDTI